MKMSVPNNEVDCTTFCEILGTEGDLSEAESFLLCLEASGANAVWDLVFLDFPIGKSSQTDDEQMREYRVNEFNDYL